MQQKTDKNELRFQLIGWVLFTACAILYAIGSARIGDMLFFVASLVFLSACIVFMYPLIQSIIQNVKD